MARSGQILESPSGKERVVFRTTAYQSGGTVLGLDFSLEPGEAVIARHFHPAQEERFLVRQGAFRLRRGHETLVLEAGDSATVPPGVVHHLENAGDGEAHTVVQFRPALRTEDLFACLFAAAARSDGRWSRRLALCECLRRFPEEIRLAGVPQTLHDPLLRLAAGLGRVWPG